MKLGFYSCMAGMPWGGSEELWWRAARRLQQQGHEIAVNYKWWPDKARQLVEIEEHGGSVWSRNQIFFGFFESRRESLKRMLSINRLKKSWLEQTAPDIVLVTLGYHPDQMPIADECLAHGIPYGINVQCASDQFFIHSDLLEKYRRWYHGAAKVFFVSEENQQKLETNIAAPLNNAEIVANPFNVDFGANPPWPDPEPVYRVACVGRIHFQSKGQDLIVDVMKQAKWRNRKIEITFYGHDQGNQKQLEDLIEMHGLQNQLKLGGFKEKVEDIWAEHHALLLPSRFEGAPLVIIEAMLCNRVTISTDIGRNRELIDEGVTGFIAAGAITRLLDETLEKAWAERANWRAMGQVAGQHIRQRYPSDPVQDFADLIRAIVPESSPP